MSLTKSLKTYQMLQRLLNYLHVNLVSFADISALFTGVLPSAIRREKLALAIEQDGYIKKLMELFHMCEDLDNTDGLHHLFEIVKTLFLLDKNFLYDTMFSEAHIMGCSRVSWVWPDEKGASTI